MNSCQNCGRANDASSVFCRFCGTKFGSAPQTQNAQFDYSAPRPYSWKTDEFQTKAGTRDTMANAAGSFAYAPAANASLGLYGNHAPISPTDPRIRCPICSSVVMPRVERKISTAGWITFALLLVFIFPLFWIGLLIKENVPFCPVCDGKLS